MMMETDNVNKPILISNSFVSQLCSGVDEKAIGTSAELIFAPIDASFTDNAPLLPSGFRIIPIDNTAVKFNLRKFLLWG